MQLTAMFRRLAFFCIAALLPAAVLAQTAAPAAKNKPPVVSLTAPLGGSFPLGSGIVVSANASDPDGTVSNVVFLANGVQIGQPDTTSPYSVLWIPQAAGTYGLTAKATDNAGASTTSSPAVTVTIVANPPPTVSIFSPADGQGFAAPATISIQANASDTNGTVTQVDFFHDGVPIPPPATASPYTATWSNVPVGSYQLTAKATDNGGATTLSTPITVNVGTPPLVALTLPASCSVLTPPATITLGADAVDLNGWITSVDFYNGNTLIGTARRQPYTVQWSNVGEGTYQVKAVATNNFGIPASTPTLAITVASPNTPSTVNITAPAAGTTFHTWDSIAIAAFASDPDGVSDVEFQRGGIFIDHVANPTSTTVGVQWINPPAADWDLTAIVTDNRGVKTRSAPVTIHVLANAVPTVHLSLPATGSQYREPATINFAATAFDSDGTVGQVDFLLNGVVKASSTTSPYQATATGVPAGVYQYTAQATDDRQGIGVSQETWQITVNANPAPIVSIGSPTSPATFTAPVDIPVSVSASDDTSVASVELLIDGVRFGNPLTTAPYNFLWSNAPLGGHSLQAKATDNEGKSALSNTVSVTVNGITSTITSPANGANYTAPAAYDVTSAASTSSGTLSQIEFYDGSTKIYTATVPAGFSNFTFTLQLSGIQAGTHVYTTKAYDTGNHVATSPAVTVNVAPAPTPPTVSITSPGNNSFLAPPASFTLQANAAATATGATITKVEFFQDGVSLGAVMSAPYSMPVSNLAAGAYSFTAVATDSLNTSATSAAVVVDVGVSVSIVDPSPAAIFLAPADIRVVANPVVAGATVSKVDFYSGGTGIGTAMSPPYSFVWQAVAAGSYSLTAVMTDSAGHVLSSSPVTIQVIAAPTASVAPGIDGSTTSDSVISLSGTVVAPLNSAVGVNGKPASVDELGNWVINDVELVPGANTITVTVATVETSVNAQTITVTQSGSPNFDLSIDKQEGFVPFSPRVTLTAKGNIPVGRVEFDFNGDGVTDYTLSTFNGSFTATLSVPQSGSVAVSAKVYDPSNALIYSAVRWIQAVSPSTVGYRALSALNGMLDKLALGNANGALTYFTGDAQPTYQDVFNKLGSTLAQVATQLGTVKQGAFGESVAEFILLRDTSEGPKAFPVYLYKGGDGVWRLEGM